MPRFCERVAGMKTECHHISFVSISVSAALNLHGTDKFLCPIIQVFRLHLVL